MLPVLVVDDQAAVREALRVLFEVHAVPCVTAATAEEAIERVRREPIGVVVQDMNLSPGETGGEEGIALFRRLKAVDRGLPVLLVTAWTSLETAVQLVKEGASDYLAKPWDDRRLLAAVRELREARRRQLGGAELPPAATTAPSGLPDLVVASEPMRRAVEVAVAVAPSSAPVLVTGPSGAGKERIAELLHSRSGRNGPLVVVNVGALPLELMEAELFGAEPGAYTGRVGLRLGRFEEADGGTLFLDEIDSLSLAGQVKLLRVLESGEVTRLGANRSRKVDVRVVSATNADLVRAVAEGRFRRDLYFRIDVVEIAVPALRDRPDDVLPLAACFLARFVAEGGRGRALAADAQAALLAHDWPGNVRELRNRLQRASLLATGPEIGAADLELGAGGAVERPTPAPVPDLVRDLEQGELVERGRIERALREADGVVARAAESLGLSRQALYRRMARLGLALERRLSG